MTVGSILLAVALLLLVGVYVFRPILTPSRRPSAPSQKETLLAQKDALIAQIKVLDLDHDMGKIPTTQYEHERIQLKQAAADTLRQIDQLPDKSNDIDAQIEAAIAALRANAVTCPNCAASITASDKFCRECGEAL